jgi:hypothetical protein
MNTATDPAPTVGDRVTPRAGLTWCNHPVPMVPHVVVAVHDYRPEGIPGECIVVLQDAAVHDYLVASGHPVNPDYGIYAGLDDLL